MDYQRSEAYHPRDRSHSPGGSRRHYRSGRSRSRDRSYSPQKQRNWTRDRRDRSPERYSSSWRVASPRRRSRSRSYDRSRSGSRERYSNRRSRSNDSYEKYQRESSLSRGGRSNSQNNRGQRVEEIHSTMYADREAQNVAVPTGRGYQKLRTAPDTTNYQGMSDDATRQQTDFTVIKQGYDGREMDDEERFLYGDEAGEQNPRPRQKQQESPQPENKDVAVTPGGFDTNALKNVLKAIGFNFGMSTEQIQSSMGKSLSKKPEAIPPPKKPVVEAKMKPEPTPPKSILKTEKPQKIQTIQRGHTVKKKAQAVENPPQQTQQYFQAYDPYNAAPTPQYNHQSIQMAQPAQSIVYQNPAPTSLGYPVAIPDPNNPGGTLLVYQQPNQAASSQQPVYHQPEQGAPQNLGHGGRIVIPPQRDTGIEVTVTPRPENDERQERLNYLQEELEKLKKQQNEMMEKKRKDSTNSAADRPQGSMEETRHVTEQAAGSRSDSSDESVKDQKEGKITKYDYLDPGNHWCRLCNTFSPDLMAFLSHLHSKAHRKAIDPYDRPWDNREKVKKQKSSHMKMKALKGSEFLIPVTGYYCTLCQTFSGDQICADEHLKGHSHNDVYKKHCKKNPSYEKKYKKKKRTAMEEGVSEEKKNGDDEEEVKAKIKTEKEEKWIEKSPKIEPAISEAKPIYPEFKPYPSDKSVYHFEPEIPANNKNPQLTNRQNERSKIERRYQPDNNRSDSRTERLPPKDSSKWNYDELLRQEDSHRRSEKDRADRTSDHGKRKRNWSPGYDEYERQQQQRDTQNNKREEYRKDERSGSRDRAGRWTEKSEPTRKKESHGEQGEHTKKNMPGFGKFTWGAGTVRTSRRFEPAPTNLTSSHSAFSQSNDESDAKEKIAIKITGKTQYPARLSSSKAAPSKSNPTESEKQAVVEDLKKKVEALKREKALRNQLSSITIPSRRNTRQSRPNTAAVMIGTRNIGKHNTLRHSKSAKPAKDSRERCHSPLQDIEADVSPPPPPAEVKVKPPLPRAFEPPPPGEEDMDLDLGNDADARSDASGISMELASDEG